MRRTLAATSLALLLAAPASAYDQGCNENGWVLTPEAGDTGPFATDRLYMGKSCDAYSPVHGQGRWCWANGGVSVEVAGASFGFAHMELYCQHPALDPQVCSCANTPLPSWN